MAVDCIPSEMKKKRDRRRQTDGQTSSKLYQLISRLTGCHAGCTATCFTAMSTVKNSFSKWVTCKKLDIQLIKNAFLEFKRPKSKLSHHNTTWCVQRPVMLKHNPLVCLLRPDTRMRTRVIGSIKGPKYLMGVVQRTTEPISTKVLST